MKATIGAGFVMAFFLIMQLAGGLALTGAGWVILIGSAILAVAFDLMHAPMAVPARNSTGTRSYDER